MFQSGNQDDFLKSDGEDAERVVEIAASAPVEAAAARAQEEAAATPKRKR